jgi:hypothetical protein
MATIAQTVIQQLGGNKFVVMTGASNFINKRNGIQFDLPRNFAKGGINRVTITLSSDDTYNVEFGKMTRKKDKDLGIMMPHYAVLASSDGIYSGSLREVFTRYTGLDTTL